MRSTPARPCVALRECRSWRARAIGLAFVTPLFLTTPARGDVGLSVAVASDDRFRGATTSDHRPVATAALSIDDPSGLYAGVSIAGGVNRSGDLRVLRWVPSAGYAGRLSTSLSFDVGATLRLYDRDASVLYARDLAELYAGLVGRRLSGHAFYAPDYDGWGHAAIYGQIEGTPFERGRFALTGHLGVLRPPAPLRYGRELVVDWRLAATARVSDRSTLSVAITGAGPAGMWDDRRSRTGLVLSATRAF